MVADCSILVVDDDPGVGEAIATALGSSCFVQTATTATAALEAISATPFDLVFLDYRLPDLPGTEVLRVIKRFFPSTLVILITGYGSEEVAVEALRGGARDYLKKPFDYHELHRRIAPLLILRRKSAGRTLSSVSPASPTPPSPTGTIPRSPTGPAPFSVPSATSRRT